MLCASSERVQQFVAQLGGYEQVLGAEADPAQKLKFPADRQAFLASRALLRLLLSHERFGQVRRANELPIQRHCLDCGVANHGQPRTAGYALSLSRTRELVLVALAPAGVHLGIDLERGPNLTPPGVFDGFDQTVLSAAERTLVSGHKHADRLRLAAFSAKESLLKASGDGLRVDPSGLSVLSADAGLESTGWLPVQTLPLEPQELFLRWINVGKDHLGSLASSRPLALRRLEFTDLRL